MARPSTCQPLLFLQVLAFRRTLQLLSIVVDMARKILFKQHLRIIVLFVLQYGFVAIFVLRLVYFSNCSSSVGILVHIPPFNSKNLKDLFNTGNYKSMLTKIEKMKYI